MCSLFLCLLLCLANFSVVANASEAEENLIDSDIRNWVNISTIDSSYSDKFTTYYSNGVYQFKYIGSPTAGRYGGIYSLTDLVVGENYVLNFDFRISEKSLEPITWMIGVGFLNGNELTFFSDETHIVIAYDNYSEFDYVLGEYNSIHLPFKYSASLGEPCVIIVGICHSDASITNPTLYLRDFSLMRQSSETEKKLDGILGWLQEIKDKIVSLPETIKTNFQTFFTDLQGKITDMKDGVTEKLGTISTEFSGYITGLGDRVSGFFTDLKENISAYFTDLWNKFSAFFEKFKPRVNVDFGFKNGYFDINNKTFHYDNNSSCMISDVICVPSGCELHLSYKYLSGGRFRFIPCDKEGNVSSSASITTYFQDYEVLLSSFQYFRVECYSFEVKRVNGYVDVGWFTYFTNTLKHKIDLKVIEIKTSIHDFFVPPEGFFEEWKVTFDLMLSDNLGFIYQAPNFVIDIVEVVQEILQNDQEVNLVFPAVEFDIAGYHIELFKDTKVDFSFLEAGIWLTLYSMYKVMLYVIFALALIKYGMSTWERTMAN